jgi:ABC-type methionine transport system ATPase subunit
VLFITHEMDTVVQIADSVARLDAGRIVESGALVDLLRAPESALGRALLPRRPHAPARALTTWFASYEGPAVPRTWLTRASAALGADLELLGASIGAVNGHTVGHATLGVPDDLSAVLVADVLAGLGLHAVPEAAAVPGAAVRASLEPVA